MNLRFITTGLFGVLALLACTRQQQPMQPETPMDIMSRQAQVAADDYPYELDVCSNEDPTE